LFKIEGNRIGWISATEAAPLQAEPLGRAFAVASGGRVERSHGIPDDFVSDWMPLEKAPHPPASA
jgi:nitrous oxide reductase accessory protein NosL